MYLRRQSDVFGSYLRAARVQSGMSQSELAKKANKVAHNSITQSVIAQYEANSVKNPDPKVVMILAEVLDVPYGDFIALLAKSMIQKYEADLSCVLVLLSKDDLYRELEKRNKV